MAPKKAASQSPGRNVGGATQRKVPTDKPVVWLHGEVKTPPFSPEARMEAGMLLRALQRGEKLSMPHAELLPTVGARCGALRIRDADVIWRIMYRMDADAVVITDVYGKKTQKIPDSVIKTSKQRLKSYDKIISK